MKKHIMILLSAMTLNCFSFCPTWADVIYVNGSADGADTGESWKDAYRNLQSALASAQNGDEIWVAAGVYRPTDGTDRTASFMMRDGVALYGGLLGGEISRDRRDAAAYETVLSGAIGEHGNHDNSYQVIRGANDAILDGFTVRGGNANGDSWYSHGGGMYNYQCSPTIANCVFKLNSANNGGGMANFGSVTVIDCLFVDNVASDGGGGMSNNGHGGGSQPTMVNCAFIRNVATNNGGALHNYECSPSITECTFSGNRANNYYGGAIYNYYSTQILSNCAFCGNSAPYGGAIYDWGGWGGREIVNCTFSQNTAVFNGGGLYNFSNTLILTNSIFWNNTAINGAQIYNHNSNLTVLFNSIQGCTPGDGNIDANPLFAKDPDPGIDGEWGTEDDDYGDLSLQHGSPCIDAGTEVELKTDIEGNPRPLDYPYVDNNGGVSNFDMGAYERTEVPGDAMTVLSPNGGELFAHGSIHNIVWGTSHEMPISDVVIEFSTDGGESWITIDTVANSGTYEWIVPTANSTRCVISVGDLLNPTIGDSSDSVFTVFECVEAIPGDVNGDCYINMADIAIIADNWLRCGNTSDPLCGGL